MSCAVKSVEKNHLILSFSKYQNQLLFCEQKYIHKHACIVPNVIVHDSNTMSSAIEQGYRLGCTYGKC